MGAIYIGSQRPELDARVEGTDLFTATANSVTSHYFSFTHDCEFNGVDIYAWDSHVGDNINLSTEYSIDGGVTWLRYKKFGKKFNVRPNVLDRLIMFPSTPSAGIRVRIDYDNKGQADVKFNLNVFKFAAREDVLPPNQGSDW